MTRQRLDLADRDLATLADVLGTTAEALSNELNRRPWFANDLLREPAVVDAVLDGRGLGQVDVSPLLFFSVIAHQAADELVDATWVADWAGPRSRLPVFDVEPLVEFSDAPGRLVFIARLLAGFATPEPAPLPADHLDLEDLVRWLDAAAPGDRIVLLRRLGDLALFQAGVFPDATADKMLAPSLIETLASSAGLDDTALSVFVDPASPTPGLDALEALGSGWYQAAVAENHGASAGVVADVAARMRPARRFLNHLADRYFSPIGVGWAAGF